MHCTAVCQHVYFAALAHHYPLEQQAAATPRTTQQQCLQLQLLQSHMPTTWSQRLRAELASSMPPAC